MLTFNKVFENQSIASGILREPSRKKRAESNLLADEKGPKQGDPGSLKDFYKCLVPFSLFAFT